jgi:hypothetical protein
MAKLKWIRTRKAGGVYRAVFLSADGTAVLLARKTVDGWWCWAAHSARVDYGMALTLKGAQADAEQAAASPRLKLVR